MLQPNWKSRSKTRTANFAKSGKYDENSGIWSEIKPVYMELQHAKCGYCEKWLESADYGSIEHDLEHYRPKSRVRAYPPISDDIASRDDRASIAYDFVTGDAWDTGYFRLAYHPLNYLTACKTCNTILKSDYFPVAAPRISGADHPQDLAGEEPFLLYPIGTLDDDPESLIGFEGVIAIPVGATLAARRRARVTIDFFQLNNREDLRRQRVEIIYALSFALTVLEDNPVAESERRAKLFINSRMGSEVHHANCARCFVRLFQSNSRRALRLADQAFELIR